jgi:hypothetical protein
MGLIVGLYVVEKIKIFYFCRVSNQDFLFLYRLYAIFSGFVSYLNTDSEISYQHGTYSKQLHRLSETYAWR